MSLDFLLGSLVSELRREIKNYTFETVAEGEDEILARALSKAYIWLKAKLKPCGVIAVDIEDEVIRQIIIKRALYELYSYAENEEIAKDKAETALEMLRGYFGDCVDAYENKKETITRVPITASVSGRSDWKGFKEHD